MIEEVYVLLDEYELCLLTGEVCDYYVSLDDLFYDCGEDAVWIKLVISTISPN